MGEIPQAVLPNRMSYQRHVAWCSVQSARPALFFQHIVWPRSYARSAHFDFSSRPCVRLYLCSLMPTAKYLPVSATIPWEKKDWAPRS
jgi:hypothetical protein